MIEVIVAVAMFTVPAMAVGIFCYLLATLRVATDLLSDLPTVFEHRSWGLRIFRHGWLLELEVGWIGRISRCIRRP